MAMPAATAQANLYTWLTSLSPAVVGLVSALSGLAIGGATGWAVKPAPIPASIPAVDAPRATPIDQTATLDHLLGVHGEKLTADLKAAVKQALDEKFPAPVQKGRVLK